MHPDLYFQGVVPPKITLPETAGLISGDWKKLDENNMGEFGLLEILKQYLVKDRFHESGGGVVSRPLRHI